MFGKRLMYTNRISMIFRPSHYGASEIMTAINHFAIFAARFLHFLALLSWIIIKWQTMAVTVRATTQSWHYAIFTTQPKPVF